MIGFRGLGWSRRILRKDEGREKGRRGEGEKGRKGEREKGRKGERGIVGE